MNNYNIIQPLNYSEEHCKYIEKIKVSINLLSEQSNIMMFARDTQQRFITGTTLSASKFGLINGLDFDGLTISDLPCPCVASRALQLEQHEKDFLVNFEINKCIDVLHVANFADGLKARVSNKTFIYHKSSFSILGVISYASEVDLRDFVNVIPTYLLRFGALGSLEKSAKQINIGNNVVLNEYEQEICFLFLMNWSFNQIAEFMNGFRPNENLRTADTIIKKKNYICQKLCLNTNDVKILCEYLFSIGFHRKMPPSIYSRIIGSKVLE